MSDLFDRMTELVASSGPSAAWDYLLDTLRAENEYQRLFEALTLRAKYELQVPLRGRIDPTQIPEPTRIQLEDRIVEACREVGQRCLDSGNIAAAYSYYQMIGEWEPIRQAIEAATPEPDQVPTLIEIALNRGVHPERGIRLVLDHYGLCQAISACETLFGAAMPAAARSGAVSSILEKLHAELTERLISEIESREGVRLANRSIEQLVHDREWLFADENYHVDTSHLNSAIRMARLIPPCDAHRLAIDLCHYGEKLSKRYQYPDPEPFTEVYSDSKRYFEALLEQIPASIEYFEQKAVNLDSREVGTYPVEVYVRLLRELGQVQKAIAFLDAHPAFPSETLAPLIDALLDEAGPSPWQSAWARKRNDAPAFLAALLTAATPKNESNSIEKEHQA